jgi:hypothetical protein
LLSDKNNNFYLKLSVTSTADLSYCVRKLRVQNRNTWIIVIIHLILIEKGLNFNYVHVVQSNNRKATCKFIEILRL